MDSVSIFFFNTLQARSGRMKCICWSVGELVDIVEFQSCWVTKGMCKLCKASGSDLDLLILY